MIHRIDVRSRSGHDPAGLAIQKQITSLGIDCGNVSARNIFLLDTDAPVEHVHRIADELLRDPVTESATLVDDSSPQTSASRIEVHLKPGVMDPVANSTEMAIRDMGIDVKQVRTGRAFVFDKPLDQPALSTIASRALANGVIENVYFERHTPARFETGHAEPFKLRAVKLLNLDANALKKLSRDGHLFLSLAEMQAIQTYFKSQNREPTDIELETLAQTWSEHCVHKTLKSAVDLYDENGTLLRRYGNLIKETIFQSTQDLMRDRGDAFCLSVFKDNAGVVAFDETDAVCFKVETHNHPSAIEPYGGSATGAGGCIRDILGTGLGAKPIANTDVFCVAFPERLSDIPLPKGIIHPRRILQQVVAGVRDYGNRMGIPTINGAVYFDNAYLGNPLVFCGCVGIIPRDKINKATQPGDAIVVMGGRTGRDGIHGATFSSAELTDTHADEFSHAVQIGNAITQKKMADVILKARDLDLFSAITDCGAGGLSSAVGEMGEKTGAHVHLDKVPLKYAGLRYDEIWISEAQERMVLSVPQAHVDTLLKLARSEDVEATVIGMFGTPDRELILEFDRKQVGRLSMAFMHDGIPMPTRRAVIPTQAVPPKSRHSSDIRERLLGLLAHPNIASKHWIIRQYDHEVQGNSVIKPLIGRYQIGPSDASVLRPKLDSFKGVAVACGMAPAIDDPYDMAIASIDEAIRNVIAIGADSTKIAILDNFCWPSVDDEITMGTLVRACEASRDAARAYGIPFISGKDSLHNQFTSSETGEVIRIPRTLLISALAVLDDVRKCVTMDFKRHGARVCLVSSRSTTDLSILATTHRAMSDQISRGLVAACHDASDGGPAIAVAEMCIASGLGLLAGHEHFVDGKAFVERPGEYVVELRRNDDYDAFVQAFSHCASVVEFGLTSHLRKLTITTARARVTDLSIDEMTAAWRGTLDW